jgi:hypothetical protein
VVRRRSLVGATVATVLGLAACGGSAQPGSTTSATPAPTASTSPTAGAIAGSFRACHQTPNQTTAVIIFFSSSDPAIVAAGSHVVFDVTPLEPTTWANGIAVRLKHGGGWNARLWAVVVPNGVVPPSELSLRVSVASSLDPAHPLATREAVTVSIPSSSCSVS